MTRPYGLERLNEDEAWNYLKRVVWRTKSPRARSAFRIVTQYTDGAWAVADGPCTVCGATVMFCQTALDQGYEAEAFECTGKCADEREGI